MLTLVVSAAAVSGARADEVDDYVKEQMSKQHLPSVTVAVLKHGKPLKVKSYGMANLELDVPASPASVYMIGSLSKQFIAAGIVLLSKEGKVGLDDSITKYLQDAPPTWQPITVRHTLTHTGGLVRESPGFNQYQAQSDAELIKQAYSQPLAFEPGERFEYSNLGYYVLAEIITRAAQKPWPQFMQERIFAPLGMNSTRTTTFEELIPERVDGYEWDDGKYKLGGYMLGVRPSGAFLSTVQDLARWDAALYTDKLFTQQEREMIWAPVQLNDGSQEPYGFGWKVEKVGDHRHINHAGTIAGFRTQMSRYVDDDLTVIVLTNLGTALPGRIALGIASLHIDGMLPRRKAVEVSAAVLDSYAGQYQMQGGRVLNVSHEDAQLVMTLSLGEKTMALGALTPQSKTHFFNEDDPRSTYVFSTDAVGRLQLAVQSPNGEMGEPLPKIDPKE